MEELRELRANYEQKIHDYEELMDIRVQLDQEIATYRALLQEEETRCVCGCVCYGCSVDLYHSLMGKLSGPLPFNES